jgi:predicted GIY-YIG superfamily endonuclease
MYEIYCAKSKISGKSYVGCTSRGLNKRMWNHKADALIGNKNFVSRNDKLNSII